jgi:hypothetical protein
MVLRISSSRGPFLLRTDTDTGAQSLPTQCPSFSAYLPLKQRIFSVYCDGSLTTRMSEWNGTTWTNSQRLINHPQPDRQRFLAFDARRNRTVLVVGGAPESTNPSLFTWEFDGTTWVATQPATPLPRLDSLVLAYEADRQRTVAIGTTDGTTSETWEYDGTTWTPISGAAPPAGDGSAVAWDPVGHRLVMFVGTLTPVQTWEYKAGVWNDLAPATSPPARSRASMAALGRNGPLVLFGGRLADSTLPTDTWQFNNGTWETVATAHAPLLRRAPKWSATQPSAE